MDRYDASRPDEFLLARSPELSQRGAGFVDSQDGQDAQADLDSFLTVIAR